MLPLIEAFYRKMPFLQIKGHVEFVVTKRFQNRNT